MPSMTDPTDALVGFQTAIKTKSLSTEIGRVHSDITFHADSPKPRTMRMTYALLGPEKEVKAVAVVVTSEPYKGTPCFHLGYAVAKKHQRQGVGLEIVQKAIDEMTNGFKPVLPTFYLEAVVGVTNEASLKIASKLLSNEPIDIVDEFSGKPAKQFFKLVTP